MTGDERTKLMRVLLTLNAIDLESVSGKTGEAVTKAYDYLRDVLQECPTCQGTGKLEIDE